MFLLNQTLNGQSLLPEPAENILNEAGRVFQAMSPHLLYLSPCSG